MSARFGYIQQLTLQRLHTISLSPLGYLLDLWALVLVSNRHTTFWQQCSFSTGELHLSIHHNISECFQCSVNRLHFLPPHTCLWSTHEMHKHKISCYCSINFCSMMFTALLNWHTHIIHRFQLRLYTDHSHHFTWAWVFRLWVLSLFWSYSGCEYIHNKVSQFLIAPSDLRRHLWCLLFTSRTVAI